MDYKRTLNITLSDKDPGAMPQRGNLPAREPEIQAYWDAIDLYRLSVEKEPTREGAHGDGEFILHDGPPYSNGDIHLGHALNKIAKDIIVKFRTMQGYRSPYVPGWDNHGMPIENEVSKEFRAKGEKPDKVTMRRRCRSYAASFVEKQKAQFKRLGVRGDWDNPYLTMDPAFEARIVEVFGELAEKGFIYRGLKPVLWCAQCETALADAEVEYGPHTSNSIYVRFPVHKDPNLLFGGGDTDPERAYVLIWTTTPWTLPANVALAVHPDADYVVVDVDGARYLLAEPLVPHVMSTVFNGLPHAMYSKAKGYELAGMVAWHPFFNRTSLVVEAPYVTMEDGTGVVHTAPGHGKEDFETGQKYGLPVLNPVDAAGRYTHEAGENFVGASILKGEADRRVLEELRASGNLLLQTPIEHSYPHCWRCDSPLIFRATVQWFMNIDHEGHREKSLEAIGETAWYPPVSINRISSMVAGRPDWCLSRQRAWGVGIPAFYCRDCGKEVLSREAINAVAALVERDSSDAWYALPAEEILPPGFKCPACGGTKFDKETDILDVWFDSGSSNRAVLENHDKWPLLRWPADLYLEGTDQHRGWFNSSLMVGVATKGRAPYEQVVTNGFTVDENGRKMSKRLGNVVDPLEVMRTYGADILRLWVASVNYFEEVRCSPDILASVAGVSPDGKRSGLGGYSRIRNTFRFLVNNLYDFDYAGDAVPDADLLDLDRWALAQLDRVVEECARGYDAYEFHRVYHAINNFCAVELSAFYLDVLKDRLYCDGKTSRERRSAQTALYRLAETLARLLAPILSHTAEEVWGYLNRPGGVPSPQLAPFPVSDPAAREPVLARWAPVIALIQAVNVMIEQARQAGNLTNQREGAVDIVASQDTYNVLEPYAGVLADVLKVSQVRLSLEPAAGQPTPVDWVPLTVITADSHLNLDAVAVRRASGVKCARCWLVREDVGVDASYPDLCGRCAAVIAQWRKDNPDGDGR